jgi:protein SCO1
MSFNTKTLLALILGAFVLMGAAGYLSLSRMQEQTTATLALGAPFVLPSSKGGTVDSASLKGKPYAIFFGFTHCPEVCPTTLYELSNSLEKLGEVGRDFRIFFVTVDPERDSVGTLRDYVSSFDPRIEALVPLPEQLPALAKAFRVFYAKVPTSDGGYTMDHTASVFLFDAQGRFAGTIAFGEDTKIKEEKLRRLIASR